MRWNLSSRVVRLWARYWRWLLAAALLAAFVALAVASRAGSALPAWDQHINEAFIAWRSPIRSRAFWLFTVIGDDALMAPLTAATGVLLWAWGRRTLAGAAAGGLIISWALVEMAKALVARTRPPQTVALIGQPNSQSMPSAHAVMSMVFIGLLVYALLSWSGGRHAIKRVGTIAGLLVAGAIGVSRVYLGAHWLSDVVAGWCLGGALLVVILSVAARWQRTRGPRALLRGVGPWVSKARWTLAGLLLLVLCGCAVLAGWLDPLL